MRIMNLKYSNKKKVRGGKRKSRIMVREIEKLTENFPELDLNRGYWHMHLPVSQVFIDSKNTPSHIRTLCIKTLINRAIFLSNMKPKVRTKIRVVACIELPQLWDSQIIIFFGDEYFENFFNRDDDYQKWSLIDTNRSLLKVYDLCIPNDFIERGYIEEIFDDDFKSKSEIWFIGELE